MNPFDNYDESIFDDITGIKAIKHYITLAIRSPDPIHLWFNGPPASAKSLILEQMEDIGGRMLYGTKFTKEGLIRILIEEQPLILLIDEIEKADIEALSPLLPWCVDGRVKSDTGKDREDFKLSSKKWMVFTASNSIKKIHRKMPELLSRFELFQFPEYKKSEFEEIVRNVLTRKHHIERSVSDQICMNLVERCEYNVREAERIAGLIKMSDNPFMDIKTIFDTKDNYKIKI